MNALHELFLFRMRTLWREPETLFWVFAFPLLTALVLGVAFRGRALEELKVAVVDGPEAEAVATRLDAVDGLVALRLDEARGRDALRQGKVALVLRPGPEPELWVNPEQEEGRSARLMVVAALEGPAGAGRARVRPVTEPGSRYIDFLIPGLLGFGLMNSSIWGLGWALVQMRIGKLLKRLVATPMRRSQFLLSFLLSRSVLAVLEILFYVAFAWVLFDVPVRGSLLGLVAFGLLGSASFAGLAFFTIMRATTTEAANGLMNLVNLPMMILSGVFFSSERFPAWMQPVLKVLPLTALNDGLRAIMTDGASVFSLGQPVLVLVLWGVIPFALAVRYFRWT
jgi:ABC-type multidrug transport system permease subunit